MLCQFLGQQMGHIVQYNSTNVFKFTSDDDEDDFFIHIVIITMIRTLEKGTVLDFFLVFWFRLQPVIWICSFYTLLKVCTVCVSCPGWKLHPQWCGDHHHPANRGDGSTARLLCAAAVPCCTCQLCPAAPGAGGILVHRRVWRPALLHQCRGWGTTAGRCLLKPHHYSPSDKRQRTHSAALFDPTE